MENSDTKSVTYGINPMEVIRRVFICLTFFSMTVFVILDSLNPSPLSPERSSIVAVIIVMPFALGGLWILRGVVTTLWENPRIHLHEHGVTLTTRSRELEWAWNDFNRCANSLTRVRLLAGLITICIAGAATFHCSKKPPLIVSGLIEDVYKLVGIIIARGNKTLSR
jgi:hypothetical protein